jgi:hypothetical protein
MEGRLPDFVVIGTVKGGTTSLFRYLASHPDVWLPPDKELHYFDTGMDRGEAWLRAQLAPGGDTRLVGEATPTYLHNHAAAPNLAAAVPDAKLIAVLRHPVDRAYSHYNMQQAKYPDRKRFRDLVATELAGGGNTIRRPHFPYLSIGRYHTHLQWMLEHYPRESLLVLLLEDFQVDPAGTYETVCEFLGVDATQPPDDVGRVYNATYPVRSKALRNALMRYHGYKRLPFRLGYKLDDLNRRKSGYAPLEPELRRRLLAYYEEENAALAKLLGRDLSAWSV